MMLSQRDFDRNSVDMASMVLDRLVNRIQANISSDNDLLMVQPAGKCTYLLDNLGNL